MGAGKSAVLLIKAHNFESRNIGVLCMKPSTDDRDGIGCIKSRIGIDRECLTIYPDYDLYQIIKKTINEQDESSHLQWILVDESQFLTSKQVEQLRHSVDDFNINVLCYGLRTDFQTHLFEGSKRLFELADDIEEMKTSCECDKKAIFNARYNELGQFVVNGEQILVGGDDKYKALCSKCYYEECMKQIRSNDNNFLM